MKASVQIISTQVGNQSHPSICIHFDTGRYLFNIGEGTQRNYSESKVRLSKVRGIFLSRLRNETLGGLPGMLLTLADKNQIEKLEIIGPVGLTHYLAAARSFVARKELVLSLKEVDDTRDIQYQDENLTVRCRRLLPFKQSETKRVINYQRSNPKKRRLIEQMFNYQSPSSITPDTVSSNEDEEAYDAELGERNESLSALCYIMECPSSLGKFDAQKAKELGVPGGPVRSLLAKGESITLDNGAIINSSDVLGPPKAGAVIVILDCPSVDYIHSLDTFETGSVTILIHLCGPEVLQDERYLKWIASIGRSCQHLFISPGLHEQEIPFAASALFHQRLNALDSELFHIPAQNNAIISLPSVLANNTKYRIGKQLMEYQFEPRIFEIKSTARGPAAVYGALPALKDSLKSSPISKSNGEFVVPLGTGSAIPGRYRNVSATLFGTKTGSILFDCGEGTLGQLDRLYGSQLGDQLRAIKLLFISHMHGDHQLGSFSLLDAWCKANEKNESKLFIVAPLPFQTWLREFSQTQNIGVERTIFIDCMDLMASYPLVATQALYKELELKSIEVVEVTHCNLSFAVSVLFKSSFKVSFSGDCRPSSEFAQIGLNSDLLIHEATMPNDMAAEAIIKRHSTFKEAIRIGEEMKAKHLLLTHFSQRVPKFLHIPTATSSDMIVGVAVDLLLVKMDRFRKLPILNSPLLQTYFGVDVEEVD